MRRSLAALTCVMACWKPLGPPRPPRREPALAMTTERLDNGLRVVIAPDASAVEVEVLVRYAVGAADDPVGKEGTAHLAEHLAFERRRDGRTLYGELARVATGYNGATDEAVTTFVERAAPEHLAELLAIEADRVTLPCADEAAVARERAIVANELRQRGSALVVRSLLLAALYGDHPYHRLGVNEATLGAITAADACAFASAGYAPDAGVVVVSGPITVADADRAVRATLGALPRRARTDPALGPVPERRRITQSAPIDAPIVVYGWPLPADLAQRARVRALAAIAADHLADDLHGTVAPLELGGDRAPIIALAIEAAPDETAQVVQAAAQRVLGALSRSLDNTTYYDESFDHVHAVAIAQFVAALEDGGSGQLRAADHALAGRDPRTALAGELRALESMDRATAIALARSAFALERASTVVLEPDHARRRAEPLQLGNVRHDDPPPDVGDPADAERPAPPLGIASPLGSARTRTLASGTQVVLLPASSMPSVDVRFVFATGIGDEPSDQPGVARLAAAALSPHAIDLPELIRFFEAGGTISQGVDSDATSFRAPALERNLDLTLSALGRWLDAGHYGSLAPAVAQLRRTYREPRDAGVDAAWRVALFGWDHPYARLPDYARLGARDVQRFRAGHYTAPALTIIVAGGFDPAVANAWIDEVFGTQAGGGREPERRLEPAKITPAATIGVVEDRALVELHIALPATGERANQLLVAALLDDAVSDVRFQLAASYGMSARLVETRLGSWYEISGAIDPAKLTEAITVIRGRIAGLRPDDRTSAVRFLRARRAVMTALALVPTSARALADRAETIVAGGRTLAGELATVEAVRTTTLRALAPQLGGIELGAAAMLLRGPRPAIDAACAVVGRKPQYIE